MPGRASTDGDPEKTTTGERAQERAFPAENRSATAGTDIKLVPEAMEDYQIHRLPIVDEEEWLVDITSEAEPACVPHREGANGA